MNQLIVDAFVALCELKGHEIERSGDSDEIYCSRCDAYFIPSLGLNSDGVNKTCSEKVVR